MSIVNKKAKNGTYAIDTSINFVDSFADALASGRESYGPVIHWSSVGMDLKAGESCLAIRLPKGFIPFVLSATVVSPSPNSGGAFYVGLNDGTNAWDDDSFINNGDPDATAGTKIVKPLMAGTVASTTATLTPTAITTDSYFITFKAVTKDLGPGCRIDLCVHGFIDHPLIDTFLS